MKFTLKGKALIVLHDDNIIGVDSENKTEKIIIEIIEEEIIDKWLFLEFQTGNWETFTTEQLDLVDNKITYVLPNSLLKKGYLQMQLVARYLDDYIWKSYVIKLVVNESINASDNLPEQYPEFIVTVLEQLSILNTEMEETNGRLTVLNDTTVKKRLSTLPTAQGRDNALIYVDDNGVDSKISIDELGKRIIATNSSTNELGQYVFKEIGGN